MLFQDGNRVQHPRMFKTVAFMPRRTEMDRSAFRTYYETRHAPLALQHFRFGRYVRNHLIEGQEPGFDCLSEFWHADWEHTQAQMTGKPGPIMKADELNFTDQPAIRSAFSEERLLAGEPRDADETGVAKSILLLRADRDANRDALTDKAREAFTGNGTRVTIDLLSPFDARALPHDAFLTFWSPAARRFDLPSGWSISGEVNAVAQEKVDAALASDGQPAV